MNFIVRRVIPVLYQAKIRPTNYEGPLSNVNSSLLGANRPILLSSNILKLFPQNARLNRPMCACKATDKILVGLYNYTNRKTQ
jgi:hypothetical protein